MTAQSTGHIFIEGEKILVLRRRTSARHGYTQFKLRTSGKDGEHFDNEEIFLSDETERVADLKAGKVITF